MVFRRLLLVSAILASTVAIVACESSDTGGVTPFEAGTSSPFDGGGSNPQDASTTDSSAPVDGATPDAADAADAGKILPQGLPDPIPYLSRADSPFNGVAFPSYLHFENWEDGLVNTPGVTPSSVAVSGGTGLEDSVDGDDGVVDGKCQKIDGPCNSGFSGSGTIEFTFDAAALGILPSHVGIAWTDGGTPCDAIFEAYDAADVLIGTKTAVAIGDNSNINTVAEDRFFSVVHTAGVKRIVVKSSSGGIEVDHLQYGR